MKALSMHDPQPQFRPVPGQIDRLAPDVARIVAPNASPMTYRGTNTYLLGTGALAVIDPGPDDASHRAAILDALAPGQRVAAILVTHAHVDHSQGARALAQATGAPVYAYGDALAGRSAVMIALAAEGLLQGGEGIDHEFAPDHRLAHNETLTGDGWEVTALHCPGHMANHLCFASAGRLFSGDHVMGWATSLVSPPDGDLSDFMASLRALQQHDWQSFLPGHGDVISDPSARLAELITHREAREAAIVAALAEGPADAATLAARIYADTPRALLPAASRNVLAQLIDLVQKKRVTPVGGLSSEAAFALC